MESDWDWQSNKNIFMKEGIDYELWKFWWSICITRTKRKIK